MKILFLSCGDHVPSSRFRILPYIPHLRAAGHQCTVASSFPQKYDYFRLIGFRLSQRLKRFVRFLHIQRARFGRYDVVFLERELFDDDTWSMEAKFRAATGALVLDVDDAVFLRHPRKFEQVARLSDVVIAGNRYLKEQIEPTNPNVVVIPTCIDTQQYALRSGHGEISKRPIVGWMGTAGNLVYLQVVAEALRNLAGRCDFELRLIAGDEGALKNIDLSGVNVRFIRWNGKTEVDELRRFDIGIMPLFADDQWNVYKCGLKLLQYMALGIPGVASPVGVNAEIVRHGENGFLADDSQHWQECLHQLIDNPELRQSMGVKARHTVEERYSIEAHLPRLVQTLQAAIDHTTVAEI